MLEAKIFCCSIVWTADEVWKSPEAVLETQQWPGECISSLKQCCLCLWHEVQCASGGGVWGNAAALMEWPLPDLLSMECLLENVWQGMKLLSLMILSGWSGSTRRGWSYVLLGVTPEPVWGWNKWAMPIVQHCLICGASSPPVTTFIILLCRGNPWQWSHRAGHAWLFRVLPEGLSGVSLDLYVLSWLSPPKALSSRCPKNPQFCWDLQQEVWCLRQAGCIPSV